MSFIEKAIDKASGTESVSDGKQVTARTYTGARNIGGTADNVLNKVIAKNGRVSILSTLLQKIGLFKSDVKLSDDADGELRKIKQVLLHKILGKKIAPGASASVLLTSSLAGDGKSLMTLMLGITIAKDSKYKVLLVDADILKGGLSKYFDVNANAPGLVDVVKDDLVLSDAIQSTNYDNLFILPAGSTSQAEPEMINEIDLEKIAARLRKRGEQVIMLVDSPPLVPVSEVLNLADQCDHTVLVVAANHTDTNAVELAVEALGEDRSASLILNKCGKFANSYSQYYPNYN